MRDLLAFSDVAVVTKTKPVTLKRSPHTADTSCLNVCALCVLKWHSVLTVSELFLDKCAHKETPITRRMSFFEVGKSEDPSFSKVRSFTVIGSALWTSKLLTASS